jgi:hypothetical protein
MPPKYHISRMAKIWTEIYALAIDMADPNATQAVIREHAVELAKERGLKPLEESHANKYIREIQTANNRGWLDSPWHTGIFAAHNSYELEISTDQLPIVMTVALRVFAGGKRLTARQAMWVGRLNALKKLDPDDSTDGDIENIYGLAVAYSAREKAATSIARRTNQGKPVIAEENQSDLDTWSLDVLVGLTESPIAPDMQLYEVLLESGYTQDPIWTSGARMGITPTSDKVKYLYILLLKFAVPELVESCKAMTRALLWLRAYAEKQTEYGEQTGESSNPEVSRLITVPMPAKVKDEHSWSSLSQDERKNKAREISIRVMKEINTEKFEAERVLAEQKTENAREIALQVMGLIDRQKAEKQKGIENDD